MQVQELWRMSAASLGRLYQAGETSPVEALDDILRRVRDENGLVNAVVAMDERRIRSEAAESTERWRNGRSQGPLDGVPFVVKDSMNVARLPTSWGTRLFRDYVPERDELPVARLRKAGAIVVGKTNVPEFALRGYTDNLVFGATRNPWDLELSPGGSSGGSAAAVAAGFAPLGLGVDAGGSIRRPAGFTGLVGLKPSAGRVPRCNGLPNVVAEYEVVGPIARDVTDATLLYRAIAQPDLRDRNSYSFVGNRPDPRFGQDVAPQRILLIERIRESPVDSEVASNVAAAATNLEALGHRVDVGEAPFDTTAFGRSFGVISRAGLAWAVRNLEWQGLVGEELSKSIADGFVVSAVEYVEALEILRAFREEIAQAYENYDLLMTPTSATPPWPATDRFPALINGEPADPGAHSVFTGFANASGYPAISIPCQPSASGLPIGFNLVGRFGEDDLLLRVAAQYERAHPWAQRWPSPETTKRVA